MLGGLTLSKVKNGRIICIFLRIQFLLATIVAEPTVFLFAASPPIDTLLGQILTDVTTKEYKLGQTALSVSLE